MRIVAEHFKKKQDKLYFEHCSGDVTRAVSQKAMVKIFKIDHCLFFLKNKIKTR